MVLARLQPCTVPDRMPSVWRWVESSQLLIKGSLRAGSVCALVTVGRAQWGCGGLCGPVLLSSSEHGGWWPMASPLGP